MAGFFHGEHDVAYDRTRDAFHDQSASFAAQARRAVAEPDLGVHVHLDREDPARVEGRAERAGRIAHWVRNHSIVRASPSRSGVSASQPRIFFMRVLSGTRRAMSS